MSGWWCDSGSGLAAGGNDSTYNNSTVRGEATGMWVRKVNVPEIDRVNEWMGGV